MSTSDEVRQLIALAWKEAGAHQIAGKDGARVVAHHLGDAVLVTVFRAGPGVGLEALLKARWQRPQDLGRWQPARLNDGALAMHCRVDPTHTTADLIGLAEAALVALEALK
jgi:hypothetical protein